MNKLSIYLIIAILLVIAYGINQITDITLFDNKDDLAVEEHLGQMISSNDIKGNTSFGDIEESLGVPAYLLAEAFLIDSDQPSTITIESIEENFAYLEPIEIGTASVRYFVSLYLHEPKEPAYLPISALSSLLDQGKISPDDPAFQYGIDLDHAEVKIELDHEEKSVNGNSTIQDLLDAGLSEDYLKELFNLNELNKNELVKEVARASGYRFQEIKVTLQNAINNLE